MTILSPRIGKRTSRSGRLHAPPARWSVFIVQALFLLVLLPSPTAAEPNEPKRVLILLQEDLSWPMFRMVDENIRATLRHGSPEGVLVFSEHLDRIHFPDPQVQARREALIQRKYSNTKLDLVIGAGDFPDDMFPDVPTVYLSPTPLGKLPKRLAAHQDVGVWVELGAKKTL